VHIVKETNNPTEYYSAMDLFVLPSLFEGNPVSALEAQACGLPVILSSNITEQAAVTDEVSYLSLDVDLWRKQICELSTMKDKTSMILLNNRVKRNQIFSESDFDVAKSSQVVDNNYMHILLHREARMIGKKHSSVRFAQVHHSIGRFFRWAHRQE
jgi:hypothetical protein